VSLDLARDTIFVTLAGSHAHGTARPGSDLDLRGVCIAPLALRVSLFSGFEQLEGPLPEPLRPLVARRLAAHPTASRAADVKTEVAIFDVGKLLGLCAAANPNALEILFADEGDWVHDRPAWRKLHAERRRFLSRKVAQTYLGYALAQLKRIRSHRAWLLHPPASRPTRADFGLPDAPTLSADDRDRIEKAVTDRIQSWRLDTVEMPRPVRMALQERLEAFWRDTLQVVDEDVEPALRAQAIASLRLPRDVAAALEAERRYRGAVRQWESYEAWQAERNPARAELERRHGYDTKHAQHLLRLMQTGLELLETGELRVRRANVAELLAVRDGALGFDQLLAEAAAMESRMRAAGDASPLPPEVDRAWVDGLLLELIREHDAGADNR
jgi:predicted nucleotidyltransferase